MNTLGDDLANAVFQVKLLYFPVSANASRDMCATTQGPATTCPLGPLTVPYTPATALSLIDFHGCTTTDYCPYMKGNTSTADSGTCGFRFRPQFWARH